MRFANFEPSLIPSVCSPKTRRLITFTSSEQLVSFMQALVKIVPFGLKGTAGQETLLHGMFLRALRSDIDKEFTKEIFYYLVNTDVPKKKEDSWQQKWIDNSLDSAVDAKFIHPDTRDVTFAFIRDNARVMLNLIRIQDNIDQFKRAAKATVEEKEDIPPAAADDAAASQDLLAGTPEKERAPHQALSGRQALLLPHTATATSTPITAARPESIRGLQDASDKYAAVLMREASMVPLESTPAAGDKRAAAGPVMGGGVSKKSKKDKKDN